jgi:hypothetical protein
MWAVTNRTPFRADRAFVRDRDGAEIWVVAVRATFTIGADGAVAAAEEQEDVCLAPAYVGEPGRSSLRYDTDLVRTKSGTDVVLHAHAHAPGGVPAPYVDVGFTVGPLAKWLRVVGDRAWSDGWRARSATDARPFVSLPICYERAWGGPRPGDDAPHPFNPVGVGADDAPGRPVPNCQYLDGAAAPHDGTPAGFGPIPCDWQPRARLAGTYDAAWERERQPLVPDDFQDAYFRCAPADQQVRGFLRGGEEVVLVNLTPEGVLRFALPRVALGFSTRVGGGTTHHRGHLHTVIIEPEARRLMMVWQTALPCHHTLYTLKETVVVEKARVSLGGGEAVDAELAS